MLEEFLKVVQENKIMPSILQTVEPIVESYIQDNTNYTQLNIDFKKSKNDINPDPSSSKNTTPSGHFKYYIEYMEDNGEDIVDIDGMHKQIALVYYAICWLFELFKKGIRTRIFEHLV